MKLSSEAIARAENRVLDLVPELKMIEDGELIFSPGSQWDDITIRIESGYTEGYHFHAHPHLKCSGSYVKGARNLRIPLLSDGTFNEKSFLGWYAKRRDLLLADVKASASRQAERYATEELQADVAAAFAFFEMPKNIQIEATGPKAIQITGKWTFTNIEHAKEVASKLRNL